MKIAHIPNNGNGNCLFQSCSYHLDVDHKTLRQQVSWIIHKYPDLPINNSPLREWIKWLNYDIIEYSNYISKDGVYGTALELTLISIMYRRCIRVKNPNNVQIAEYFPEFGNPFYLLFMGNPSNGHYEALL